MNSCWWITKPESASFVHECAVAALLAIRACLKNDPMETLSVTRDSEYYSIEEVAVQQLTQAIRGKVIVRGEPSFDEARRVYNGMIDRNPLLIIMCHDVADVITAVNFGRDQRLPIAVRSGGHNGAGLAVCDDGVVIDLSPMKGIFINRRDQTARVQAGCLLGDIDHVTQVFGMAVPTGILSSTGIGGLTLGGGVGHLSRAYGLTVDSLLEAEVVLADGSIVTANERSNPDLFWAIRGGGGNFGIAVSFLFRMQKAGTVYGGPMLWDLTDAEAIMRYYREFILKASANVYGYFAFLTVPPVSLFPESLHLRKMCAILWCVLGDADKARKAVDRFRQFREPALDYTGDIPFASLQSMFDPLYPKGMQWYWKADFVKDLPDEAVKLNVEFAYKLPTPHSTMHLYPINGAVHKKKNGDTAFAYRDANWAQVIVGVDPDPEKAPVLEAWAREYWAALHPFSAGGAYINFMMEEGQERVKASYRGNYDKLAKIKSKYDPKNLFRLNQNIRPR